MVALRSEYFGEFRRAILHYAYPDNCSGNISVNTDLRTSDA